MSLLLKARDIPINHLFRDPATEELYIMRAFDSTEGTCLAQNTADEYWHCAGDYPVRLELHPVEKGGGD